MKKRESKSPSRSTKRALTSSVLALVLCFVMLLGTTFAWFTDTASTKVNSIQAGTLDVALEMSEDGGETWVSAEGKELKFLQAQGEEKQSYVASETLLWEPGCAFELPELRVRNNGNLALKYEVVFAAVNGDSELANVLDVQVKSGDDWLNKGTLADALNAEFDTFMYGHLDTKDATESIQVRLHMQETANNDYQGLSISGIAVTVYATQYTYEYDSYGKNYDAGATLPDIWDGTVGTLPGAVNGVITINTASELAALAQKVDGTANNTLANVTIKLNRDIDLSGYAWTPIGLENSLHNNFQGTFDGQGHTIYGLTVSNSEPVGFFGYLTGTVKNLNFDGATVTGNHWGGVVAGYASYEGASIENCTVTNSTVALSFNTAKNDDGDKAGAITGYLNGNVTVKNNTVDGCTIIAYRDAGGLIGCNGTADSSCVTGNTVSNTNVYTEIADVSQIVGRQINDFSLDTTSNTATSVTAKSGVTAYVGGKVNLVTNENDKVAYVADATVTAEVSENFNRIYSDNATFVNCTFNGDGKLWFKDTATFINCTFNTEINNAEPVAGTIKFENCTFNKAVHFAPASAGVATDGKFFEATGCTFNENLTLSGFASATLTNCELKDNNWAGASMTTYNPVTFDNCSLANGVLIDTSLQKSDVTVNSGSVVIKQRSSGTTITLD